MEPRLRMRPSGSCGSAGQRSDLARAQTDVVEARFGAAAMAKAYDLLYCDALGTRQLIG